jgi:hypothetical protein
VIDLLLGLCRADDPYYSQLLVDKFLFMRPEDQLVLRDCHEKLVHKFIEKPAVDAGVKEREGLTASGPPLPVLLKSLRKLADLRAAAERDDIPSRYRDMEELRAALG